MTCEWPGCSDPATHTVSIQFPGGPLEQWAVCRPHDGAVKFQAISSRPVKPPSPTPKVVPSAVHCGECDRLLDEPTDLPVEQRTPCPACQSLRRLVKVQVSAVVTMSSSMKVTAKQAGKGAWIQKQKVGDDYTRLLAAMGERELDLDRANNRYRERIVLYDGTTIVSAAKLTDHT